MVYNLYFHKSYCGALYLKNILVNKHKIGIDLELFKGFKFFPWMGIYATMCLVIDLVIIGIVKNKELKRCRRVHGLVTAIETQNSNVQSRKARIPKSMRKATKQKARLSYSYWQLSDTTPQEKLDFEEMLVSDIENINSESGPRPRIKPNITRQSRIQESLELQPEEIRILEKHSSIEEERITKTLTEGRFEALDPKFTTSSIGSSLMFGQNINTCSLFSPSKSEQNHSNINTACSVDDAKAGHSYTAAIVEPEYKGSGKGILRRPLNHAFKFSF